MDIIISGHDMDLGESLESYIEEKLNSAITKYFKNAVSADVKYQKESDGRFKVTIKTNIGSENDVFFVDNVDADPRAAFNIAIDKLQTQLRRYHDKIKSY